MMYNLYNFQCMIVLVIIFTFFPQTYSLQHSCQPILKTSNKTARLIEVKCRDGVLYVIKLSDFANRSNLEIKESISNSTKDIFSVDFDSTKKETLITVGKARLDLINLKDFLAIDEPVLVKYFSDFGEVARLIHDKFEFKGWESPSAMVLYGLGMAVERYKISKNVHGTANHGTAASTISRQKRHIDDRIYTFHGPSPTLLCSNNGTSVQDIPKFTADECPGLCGPICYCWEHVCGDCCVHPGCERHDAFCNGWLGLLSGNCFTLRGILWDTLTDIPYDC